MEKIAAVLATTHVDRHNEAFALSALEGMAEQLNRSYLPVGVEHDPRIPPIGRVASAEVRKREDGEYEIAAELEIFESGDQVLDAVTTRQTIVRFHTAERAAVIDDRSLLNEEDQALIGEIRQLLDADNKTDGKKALEPITVLTIAAAYVGGKVVDGFFGQIGANVWERVKDRLTRLFARRRESPAQLLNLAATIEVNGDLRLVEVILSDPTPTELEQLDLNVVENAIQESLVAIEASPLLVRFVFTHSRGKGLRLAFAVATNGLPVLFGADRRPRQPIDRLSLGGGEP